MDFLKDIKKTSDLLKQSNSDEKYQEIDLNDIIFDEKQPRKTFNDIDELALSIKEHGVLSPITVRKAEDNKYIICYGERRFRASQQAGLQTIPAIIVNSEEDLLERQLVENIQRSNLSHDEIANAISELISSKKAKKKDLAKKLGKSNAYISNYCSFAKMDEELKNLLNSLTNDITLIIEINKIIDSSDEKIKDKILKFLNSQESINRDTPKKIKEKFIENKVSDNVQELESDSNLDNNTDLDATTEFKQDSINESNNHNEFDNYNSNDYIDNINDEIEIKEYKNNSNIETKNDEYNTDNSYSEQKEIKEEKQTPKEEFVSSYLNLRCYLVEEEMSIFDINTDQMILSLTDEFFNKLRDEDMLSKFNQKISDFLI